MFEGAIWQGLIGFIGAVAGMIGFLASVLGITDFLRRRKIQADGSAVRIGPPSASHLSDAALAAGVAGGAAILAAEWIAHHGDADIEDQAGAALGLDPLPDVQIPDSDDGGLIADILKTVDDVLP